MKADALARLLAAAAPDRVVAAVAMDAVQPILPPPSAKRMPAKSSVRRKATRKGGR